MPKKILLADDSITIQKVVELTFSDADYEVTAVNNGAKAIAKLAEMRPDIILSDIIMPEKNGYEVCEYVKSHPEFRNIPVVLLTGTFEPFDPDRAEKAGCDAVVTKPFESQSLIQKVEELIAQSSNSVPANPAPEPEAAAAPSPWTDDTEVVPLPEPSPFSTASGSYPNAGSDPFTHDADIFNAPPPPPLTPSMTTEMPFETPAVEEFSPETRAFPKMSFEEMQQMAAAESAPPPPPPPAAEASPWDEPSQPEFGGETRAFPRMTFDEMLAAEQQPAMEASAEPEPEPESESPFGAPPPPEEFSGETRAFPKMSFEEMEQMAAASAPPPPPEPEPPAEAIAEPSPWDEAPEAAFGGETRAFPKMTFDEMLAAQPAPEASPWDEPAIPEPEPEPEPAWMQPLETSAVEDLPVPESYSEPALDDSPVESYAETPMESYFEPPAESPVESYVEQVPEPEAEPMWEPAAEAEAQADLVEPPVPPPPPLAPETPSIPIAARDLTDEQVDRIARRVVELMSDHVVRNIAWEVIPDVAEMAVKERIRQLESEA